jgi:hypothetical protein
MNDLMERSRRWILFLMLLAACLVGGSATADASNGRGRRMDVYKLLPAVLTADDAKKLADEFGLVPLGSDPTGGQRGVLFGDADGHVRMVFGDGSVRFFPALDPGAAPPPTRGQAIRMVWDFAEKHGFMMRGQPMLKVGEITTLSNQGGEMQGRDPANGNEGSLVLGEPHDVLRNVQLVRQIQGMDVLGPSSLLSFDVGAGGIIGVLSSFRPIDPKGMPMEVISRDEAFRQFMAEFPYPVSVGRGTGDDDEGEDDDDDDRTPGAAPAAGDQTTGRLVSAKMIYYEQGGEYLQPAYLFMVVTTSPEGLIAGHTWLVPAVRKTPEPIVNRIAPGQELPILAEPVLINPVPLCVQPETVKYGRYLLREDDPGWTIDTQGFRTNIEANSALIRFFIPSLPPVENAQYYWNYPWLWEPTGSPATDYSPSYPGSVNVALIEGHGGQWIISTLKNCCDVIDLPKITGFGGYHSPAELTDYVIWQSCDVVPAPGDPYGFNYTSPHSPFDVWFGMFDGMRGTYGYRTTMNIWNGVGAKFGGDLGIGAANLSAWFTECNNNVFHHGGGWNYGSAVLVSGHEGDTLYDTCPLPPPGSLTIWWQHP